MYFKISTNSIKQCRNTSVQRMDSSFNCTMYCSHSEQPCTQALGLITSNLTTRILAEKEEFNRVEMRTKTARRNSGIKQLYAFLIRFFNSLP